MKLIGYTCTYNESGLIPYVMPYVEAFGYDKFIVWDNESTDNTVELLSKYPFVEVRSYDSNGEFNDILKRDLQARSYEECKEMAKDDVVWMTWMDFDEVLFLNSDVSLRQLLDVGRRTYGYNCFYKRMINLFLPYDFDRTQLFFDIFPNKKMIHTVMGIRGSFWTGGGMKPLMFCVNDLPDMLFFPGNHYALSCGNSKAPNPFNGTSELYAFHLKYIDRAVMKEKWEGYAARGKTVYVEQLPKFDRLYDGLMGTTFPLEQYFLIDGISSVECLKGEYWSGIKPYQG